MIHEEAFDPGLRHRIRLILQWRPHHLFDIEATVKFMGHSPEVGLDLLAGLRAPIVVSVMDLV